MEIRWVVLCCPHSSVSPYLASSVSHSCVLRQAQGQVFMACSAVSCSPAFHSLLLSIPRAHRFAQIGFVSPSLTQLRVAPSRVGLQRAALRWLVSRCVAFPHTASHRLTAHRIALSCLALCRFDLSSLTQLCAVSFRAGLQRTVFKLAPFIS
jgi:hypothetical protein